jgi:hypothetical protein
MSAPFMASLQLVDMHRTMFTEQAETFPQYTDVTDAARGGVRTRSQRSKSDRALTKRPLAHLGRRRRQNRPGRFGSGISSSAACSYALGGGAKTGASAYDLRGYGRSGSWTWGTGLREPGPQGPGPQDPLLQRLLRMRSLQGSCHRSRIRTHWSHQKLHLCCIVLCHGLRDPCLQLHCKCGTRQKSSESCRS